MRATSAQHSAPQIAVADIGAACSIVHFGLTAVIRCPCTTAPKTTVIGSERLRPGTFLPFLFLRIGVRGVPASFTFQSHSLSFRAHNLTYQDQVLDFGEQGRALAETPLS